MKNIDWKAKLSSRKLWAAVAGFVTAVAAALGADEMTTNQIVAIITAVPLAAMLCSSATIW